MGEIKNFDKVTKEQREILNRLKSGRYIILALDDDVETLNYDLYFNGLCIAAIVYLAEDLKNMAITGGLDEVFENAGKKDE